MRGKIKWWNKVKGYGFVAGEDKDYFVHHTGMKIPRAQRDELKGGEAVEFEVTVDERGPKAIGVSMVTEGA